MNTIKRLTRTTLTPAPLHSSLGTDLYIPYGQAAALSSSPLCEPSLVCSLLYPSSATARRAPDSAWPSTPLLAINTVVFSNVCQIRFSLFYRRM